VAAPGHRERGLALVSVLWGLAVLSLIAASMLSAGLLSARMSRNAWAAIRTQTAADAVVQRAVLSLLDKSASGRWRVDGTPRDVSFDGVTVTVSIQDEAGKIDLNKADAQTLQGLFESEGLAPDDAAALADHIVDWRTPRDRNSIAGGTSADYSGSDYDPRNGPFQSIDELRLVAGMTPALYARAAPVLTLYSHSASIDPDTAPREALLAQPGMTEDKVDQILATRHDAATSSITGDFGQTITVVPRLIGRAYAITATARLGRAQFLRQAVVEMTGDANHPFWFVAWE
jgi:general secretion pathway protein K